MSRIYRKRERCHSRDALRRAACEAMEGRVLLSGIIYVDVNSPGPMRDGTTWANAYADLQLALGAAIPGDTIRVADGTYKPTSGTDRTISFQLKDGVGVYGGYAGYGAGNPDARDVAVCSTILSGEIGAAGSKFDNTYHVVVGSGTGSTTVLDGFTITAGCAGGLGQYLRGSGMYNASGSPTLANCAFSNNTWSAISNEISSSPTLTNCTFSGNLSYTYGGGMYNSSSRPTLINCAFTANSADDGGGGGMYNNASSPTLTNCTFNGNFGSRGGGMRNDSSSAPSLTDCAFSGNTTHDWSYGRGGGMYNDASSPTLTNCTFTGNTAFDAGGGIYNVASSPKLTNGIVWGNTAPSYPQISDTGGTMVVTYSDIQGGWIGTQIIDSDPLFVRNPNTGIDGKWGTADDDYGDLQLLSASPAINVGLNSAVSGVSTDLAGGPRVDGGTVDLGAYEHRGPRIVISSASVAENQPAGTNVGTLSMANADAGDTFTYTLVSGTGSSNNASFTISGNALLTAATFDCEVASSYSIRVRSTNALGVWTEKAFTVSVTNINETPTDIALSAISIAENQPIGTTVGTLSASDPDAGDSFTYTLVSGNGSTGNASFGVAGSTLKANAVFDFATQSSYSIRVRATDAAGLWTEKVFTVGVIKVDRAPTDIALSASPIAENQPAGTSVGVFSATDPDAGDSVTYTLVGGPGSGDNASFSLVADTLTTAASFDYDTKSSYSIRVRATDAGGLWTENAFTIAVTNVNESPTNIGLAGGVVAENQPAGTNLGILSTTDPDTNDSFTYTMVNGTGGDDNGMFAIAGNALTTADSFDYETKNIYSIRVRSTDAGGLWTEKMFTIGVANADEAPTDVGLSVSSIAENRPAGTSVGVLTATDADAGDTVAYALVGGTGSDDNALFTLTAGNLKTAARFDCESRNSYSIRVRATDAGGLWLEKVFTIGVSNVNESPTDIRLSVSSVAEHQPAGTSVGVLSTIDPDLGDAFTYALVSGIGNNGNAGFSIAGDVLVTAMTFDYAMKNSYAIRVRATDAGGLLTEKAFTINVSHINAAPTGIGISGSTVAEGRPIGTTVGVLSSIDPDAGDTFTYALAGGTGDTDNGSFAIAGNTLSTAAVFDQAAKSSYSIRVRALDAGGLWTEQVFTISVTGVNKAPTDIGLAGGSVAENQPAGTTVGTLSTADPDAGDGFTYTLVGGAGGEDNAAFAVAGNTLVTAGRFDFETKNSYSIRMRATDAGGLWTEKGFAIGVTNVNEAPTDVVLAPAVVAWGATTGTTVGTLNGTDPDGTGALGFSIVAGIADAAAFAVVGNVLQTTAVMDRASTAGYSLRVRVTDAGGLWCEKDLRVGVLASSLPATSSIGGTVFNDVNADGVRSKSEGILKGQKVFFDSNNNGKLDAGEISQATSSTGAYAFGKLAPGLYHLRALPAKGWRVGGPIGGYDVTLGVGQTLTKKDIGLTQMALVSGTVFNDANGNKIKAATEAGLAGWTVFEDKDNDGVLDNGELSARTNAAGAFSLNLAAGSYTLRVAAKTGYKVTTPAGGKMALKLATGQVLAERMFGVKK